MQNATSGALCNNCNTSRRAQQQRPEWNFIRPTQNAVPLEEVTRSRALPAEFVQRAKVVLLLADGESARTVATKLAVARPTIAK